MFKSARIRLTAWYLLIIMLISILFSLVIYKGAEHELDRVSHRQQRMRGEFSRRLDRREWIEPIEVDEIRQRIILMLLLINSGILLISGAAGYFLAGRTLKPIKEMVDEQNRFISDASHELRTPLTSLKSAMEVSLRDKDFTIRDAKTLIAESIVEVNKLQSLSDGLLQLTQYQRPNGNTKFEKLQLRVVVDEAIKKVEPIVEQKDILIKNETIEFEVEANKYGLVDLLVILLDNALKYSQSKSKITIYSKKTDGSILLTIKDEGIGIAQKDLPHIFGRFYRADSARSKSTASGYGLGLSIAKKIVELHRGSITIDSKLNKGTTVSIRLPLKHS